jgi:hypothetical protein
VRLAAGLAGEGLGKGARVTRVRFGGSDGGGAAPASGTPAAREGWPLRLPSAGERRLGEAGEDHVSFEDQWMVASLCDE